MAGDGKDFYLKFVYRDWLSDPQLARCRPSTRGIWMDWLCVMCALDKCGQLTGSLDQLARDGRCRQDEARNAIQDLEQQKAADVERHADGSVTLVNRRMAREFERRKSVNSRKLREREKRRTEGVTRLSPADYNFDSNSELWVIPGVFKGTPLITLRFARAWRAWEQHRSDIGKPMTSLAVEMLAKKLIEWGEPMACASIEHSIANGWQGVWQPDAKNAPRPKPVDADGAARAAELMRQHGAKAAEQHRNEYLQSRGTKSA